VVLFHTLIYHVEQAFLIHKPDGNLILHVSFDHCSDDKSENIDSDDYSDNVAGQLKAIMSFAQDSFGTSNESGGLETLEVGGLTVWIVEGPEAFLAVVIRGVAPDELRAFFNEVLQKIHREQSEALEYYYDMDMAEAFRPYLESCLKAQYATG
jgi:hypothetical protein